MQFVNIEEINAGIEKRTTYMIRRLARYLTSEQLVVLMLSTGVLSDTFDLVYVPIYTGKSYANRGYAFINFKSAHAGALFLSLIRHSHDTDLSLHLGRCDIVYAHIQGKMEMIFNHSLKRNESLFTTDEPSAALPPGLLIFE